MFDTEQALATLHLTTLTPVEETDLNFVHISELIMAYGKNDLATMQSIDAIVDARAKTDAIGRYITKMIKSMELKLEAQNNIADIRIRQERKIGQMLKDMAKNPGSRVNGGNSTGPLIMMPPDEIPTLADVGVDKNQSVRWQLEADLPDDEFEDVVAAAKENGWELTSSAVQKAAKKHKKQVAKTVVPVDLPAHSERYHLLTGDIADLLPTLEGGLFDAIITDPPYPREYLHVYETLAKHAPRLLKPGGSLLVMCGQSYLPEVMALMTPYLQYAWTLSYLTPGGQSAQIWQRKVNTFWKPVLWFTNGDYKGDWIGDVLKSDVNANDKRFHEWGQSESGMADIIERFTYPGQHILDPFLGGGTTGVVALRMNRLFTGIDMNPDAIQITLKRIEALQ
jgi:16S rRNA G966 N2-methylase RsmD